MQSFSADLDSMFGLSTGEGGVDHLSQTVQDKYGSLSTREPMQQRADRQQEARAHHR